MYTEANEQLTPNELATQQQSLYSEFRKQRDHFDETIQWAGSLSTEDYNQGVNSPAVIVKVLERRLEDTRKDHQGFAQEHSSELYDLAIVLAYLDGQEISTKNAVSVGKQAI